MILKRVFFFCKSGEVNQFFFKFSSHHPLFLSIEDSCSSRLKHFGRKNINMM